MLLKMQNVAECLLLVEELTTFIVWYVDSEWIRGLKEKGDERPWSVLESRFRNPERRISVTSVFQNTV